MSNPLRLRLYNLYNKKANKSYIEYIELFEQNSSVRITSHLQMI